MPHVFEHLVLDSDLRLIRAARKRGGAAAAQKVKQAIIKRIDATSMRRERERQEMMASPRDETWPPPFLSGGK
jgi:hypothetical protein